MSSIRDTAKLREDALSIALASIEAVKPDASVKHALANISLSGNVYLVAVGKAAWQMASSAIAYLDQPVKRGIVLTKYGHVMGELPEIDCFEAGHPVPDENSFHGTEAVLKMTADLTEDDTLLFLLSGGGSALFEKPLILPEVLQEVTRRMLASGADIVQMNTIRKRLSGVKGGKFAQWCAPAKVEAIILSDILGDPLDMIASGPAAADSSTCEQALELAEKYDLIIDDTVEACLSVETPKQVTNVHTQVVGSVKALCTAAAEAARSLGYEPVFLTDQLACEAKEAGRWMGSLLNQKQSCEKKLALIAGGETVVHLTGDGLGGRNQELALSAAKMISGIPNTVLISVGSDGTDGPTDVAGGIVDGNTISQLKSLGIDHAQVLRNNDSYHALKAVDGLVITGPTGTNVNDVVIGLIG